MSYSQKATCRFDVTSWKEEAYVDIDEGEGTTSGEMYYPKRGLTLAGWSTPTAATSRARPR